jgi:hypothetical protein
MVTKRHEAGTKQKVARYSAGIAILLILISFIYQWKNGLEVDTTENFGLAFAVIIFISSFMPKRKRERNVVGYTAGIAILLILISFIYQWKNSLEIDTTENFSLAIIVAIFLSSFMPKRKRDSK